MRLVVILCEIYGLQIPPTLRGSGPSGRVQVQDILPLLYDHSRNLVAATVTRKNDMNAWNYANSNQLVSLGMELKPEVNVRSYQLNVLQQIMHGGYVYWNNVKMPCASGKTLLGLLLIQRLKAHAIIFTNSTMASHHWLAQIYKFFTPPKSGVAIVGSDESCPHKLTIKRLIEERPSIIICSYQMMTSEQKHTEWVQVVLGLLKSLPFAIKIMDEAQTAAAHNFRKTLEIESFVTISVSASFEREDEEMQHLFENISPNIIAVERSELIKRNLLPPVKRVEVHIQPARKAHGLFHERQLAAILHARKISVCLSLVNYHARLRDNIIIFCDDLAAIAKLSKIFENFQFEVDVQFCGTLTMHTPLNERLQILEQFRQMDGRGLIFMSKVGDIAIDLPGANVLIQTSCVTKSKNQEIQRFGRIQRPIEKKKSGGGGAGASGKKEHISYSLITKGSEEEKNVVARRDYMTEESYETTIVNASQTQDSRYDEKGNVEFVNYYL